MGHLDGCRPGVAVLPICPSCGKVNREGANFCAFCAVPLVSAATPGPAPTGPSPPPSAPMPPRSEDECFGTPRERRAEPSFPGGVSFAFFLIIVGTVFLANPGLFTDFELWTKGFTATGGIPRPPGTMIWSAVIFFAAAGVFDFVTAGIRHGLKGRPRKVLQDIMTGLAKLVLAGLTYLYLGRSISGPVVVASELVIIGFLIIFYLIAVSRPKATPRMM
jgi:hypothetical protein